MQILAVRADGPAAIAGLAADQYLHAAMAHSVDDHRDDRLVVLTSSKDFDKIVRTSMPGDMLSAEMYAVLCGDLALHYSPPSRIPRLHAVCRIARCCCLRRWSDSAAGFRLVPMTIGALRLDGTAMPIDEVIELRNKAAEGLLRLIVASWKVETHSYRKATPTGHRHHSPLHEAPKKTVKVSRPTSAPAPKVVQQSERLQF